MPELLNKGENMNNYSTIDAITSINAVVEERHKLLDMNSERTQEALRYARLRIGGCEQMAQLYGVAGFIVQYHNLTRYASEYLKSKVKE